MSVTPPSSSRHMSVAERLAAPNSSYTQTFNGSQLYHSRHGSSPLGKHSLDCFPALPRHGGEHTPPRFAKRQKIVKTSLDGSRNCEVRDHMNKQMLDLARMTREVYAAKMQYQRLRMQELEMIKLVMGDELEETQGCLNQMERQVGQIHQDLLDSGAISGSNAGLWTHLRLFPRFSQDSSPSCDGDYSARDSGYDDNTTGYSSPISGSSPKRHFTSCFKS
ncbi:hypothetical protein HD554DRAFT_2043271 [Boletus coccyginus]|nr:hypothetical protein HD554DRAFT_2043271 [Boletus coccyginus]